MRGGSSPCSTRRRSTNIPPAQFLPPNTFLQVCLTPDTWAGDRGREWSRGSFIMASYNHFYTPNSKYPDCTDNGRNAAVTGPRSFHPGGVNMLMLDGHVQFIKDSVSLHYVPRDLHPGRRRGGLVGCALTSHVFLIPGLLGRAVRFPACPSNHPRRMGLWSFT